MNRTDMPTATLIGDRSYAEIRKAWQAAKLHPLWEIAVAHKLRGSPDELLPNCTQNQAPKPL